MKMPCELMVTHILPVAKGALAKELVSKYGKSQVEVARMFGVTSAAVSQYIKGVRGGGGMIDKTVYRDDFYDMLSETARKISEGMHFNEAMCSICGYVKNSGMLRALYVYEGYDADQILCFEYPKVITIG